MRHTPGYMYPPVCVGIDLGTTNSVVAVYNAGEPRVLRYNHERTTVPSMVAYLRGGEAGELPVVGAEALEHWSRMPEHAIFSTKRFLGHCYDDTEVTVMKKSIPFEVVPNPSNNSCNIKVGSVITDPQTVASMILHELKSLVQVEFPNNPLNAVVAVPAYFGTRQRECTRHAAKSIGFNEVVLMNEPTAAAVAYGVEEKKKNDLVCVIDFGGGTFDVTLMKVEGCELHVIESRGDAQLGGDNIDEALMIHFIEEWGISRALTNQDKQLIRKACRGIKEQLSEVDEATDAITLHGQTRPMRLNRVQLDTIIKPIVNRAMNRVDEVLAEAKQTCKGDIDGAHILAILVGGTCKVPAIVRAINKRFQQVYQRINPDEAVALGAAVYSATLWKQKKDPLVITDKLTCSIGVGLAKKEYSKLLLRGTPIGESGEVTAEKLFRTTESEQTQAIFAIYQGDANTPSENIRLGSIHLDKLPKADARKVRVKLRMTYQHRTGELSTVATETQTGQSCAVTWQIRATDNDDSPNVKEYLTNISSLATQELADLRSLVEESKGMLGEEHEEDLEQILAFCTESHPLSLVRHMKKKFLNYLNDNLAEMEEDEWDESDELQP
eukprot:Sspe_Gene.84242::Locus_55293_Transcript_1_1_Confidence_1.000_Length_2057::g.84242::m.84242/K04043/dnaK, HSPA9; molecular chaperone DnaK